MGRLRGSGEILRLDGGTECGRGGHTTTRLHRICAI
jgi:hypothetical protein